MGASGSSFNDNQSISEFLFKNADYFPLYQGHDQKQVDAVVAKLKTSGVVGGYEGGVDLDDLNANEISGGADKLQQYGNTMYSNSKEKLIRQIAKDVFKSLNMNKDTSRAPIDQVVNELSKMIAPTLKQNKSGFGDNVNKSSSIQKRVIEALASAINHNYSGVLIDVSSLDENAIASKVSEVIYSLIQGLHTEFMTVAGDAMRVMNNMQVVNNYLDAAYKKQRELVANSGDSRLRDHSNSTDEIYKTLKSEYERQSAVLANLLNISIGPTGKSLISTLEDSKEFVGVVKDLRSQVGTKAFGDKLAYLLSGLSTAAHSADLISKSLKKIGMSVSEFKNASNAQELRSKIFRHISSQKPTSKRLDEMMNAAKIIYEANYDHAAISKLLKSGAYEGGASASDSDVDDNDPPPTVEGGADDDLPAYWMRKSLSKKIDNKKKYRDLVLKDFKNNLRNHYRRIVDSANQIAHRIGNGLVISENLKSFVDAFSVLPDVDSENLHISLSGYAKDSVNKEKREQFISKFDVVMHLCELLSKDNEGAVFKTLGSSIAAMIKDLDNFSDNMVKALTEIHIDTPDEISKAIRSTTNAFYGAADNSDFNSDGGWVPFNKVRNEMVYYYSIANVKDNLARTHQDFKSYTEDYEQILGEEAAWLIDRISSNYLAKIELITDSVVTGAAPGAAGVVFTNLNDKYSTQDVVQAQAVATALNDAYHAGNAVGNPANIAHGGKTNVEWALANLKTFWQFQMKAKVNMVKVSQAVDLYLKAFTDGIIKNPNSIGSVVKMLSEVEIVAKWFNDRSGDNLASLFEVFPCSPGAVGNVAAANTATSYCLYNSGKDSIVGVDGSIKINFGNNTHYYQYLEERWATNNAAPQANIGLNRGAAPNTFYNVAGNHYNLPGNPYIGRPLFGNDTNPEQCAGIITLSSNVVKSMRALENILSAFKSVGSKLGDVDPLAKTFMTPGEMFNNLCDYVAASAFSTEFTPMINVPAAVPLTAALYKGKVTQATINTANIGGVGVQNYNIPTNGNTTQYRGVNNVGAVGAVAAAGAGLPIDTNLNWSQDLAEGQNYTLNNNVDASIGYPAGNGEHGVLTGVSNVHNSDTWRKYTSVAMAGLPAENTIGTNKWKYHDASKDGIRNDLAGWRDHFYDTDNLFQMTIKSIIAKIFTVVDSYRLLHRPVVDRRAHYSLNPLRTIIGGNDEEDPTALGGAVSNKVKIIPDALELYYRLILLAEWYREHFSINEADEAPIIHDVWRITVVPGMDGIWSDFVEIIFDKASYVKAGNYSESQVQKLILAMNSIWTSYKSRYPKTTVRSVLNAFVLEMNRAFGFLKKSDIEAYTKDRRNMYNQTTQDGDTENYFNYDILNANDTFGSRPAPSDKFSKVSVKSANKRERNMIFLQEAVEQLRKKIDVEFLKETHNLDNKNVNNGFKFQETLSNYKLNLQNAKSDVEQYKVVLSMLQSSNKSIDISSDKLIMVHEAIAAPLVVLYSVYKVLARFNSFAHGTSLKHVKDFNTARWNNKGLVGNDINNDIKSVFDAFHSYRSFIDTKYNDISSSNKNLMISMFARALTGMSQNLDGTHGYITRLNIPRFDTTGAAPVVAGTVETEVIRLASAQAQLQNAVDLIHLTNIGIENAAPANIIQKVNLPILTCDDINGKNLMQDILSALLDFGSNQHKLVGVTIGTNGNINVDFSSLEEVVKDLLTQVKENIQKIKLSFTTNESEILLNKFENTKVVGSARWLEEHLVQTLFNNRDKCGLPVAIDHLRYNFDKLSTPKGQVGNYVNNAMLNIVFGGAGAAAAAQHAILINAAGAGGPGPFNVAPFNVAPVAGVVNNITNNQLLPYVGVNHEHYTNIHNALRGLIYYENVPYALSPYVYPVDNSKFPGNVIPLRRDVNSDTDKQLSIQNSQSKWSTAGAGAAAISVNNIVTAVNDLMHAPLIAYTSDPNQFDIADTNNRSLMTSLNNILHMYLYTNVDDSSSKFYAPLIENFATSAASLEVIQSKAFPNISTYDVNASSLSIGKSDIRHSILSKPGGQGECRSLTEDVLGSPPENTVIYASNALICRSIMNTTIQNNNAVQKKKFLYESLTDIPDYIIERMKVNLPFYSKMFSIVHDRANLLRQILTNASNLRKNITSSKYGRIDSRPLDTRVARLTGYAENLINTDDYTSDKMSVYLDGLLNKIINCAKVLRKSSELVYKELQDKPVAFFEVSKDFIQDYRNSYGNMPLMPVSSILAPLRCMEGDPNKWKSTDASYMLLPTKENGSSTYKFNFATRLVLAKSELDLTIDHFPGAKEIYNSYSSNAPRNSMIAVSDFNNTITNMVKLGKFLIDGAVYGRLFNKPSRNLNISTDVPQPVVRGNLTMRDWDAESNVLVYPTIYDSSNVFHAINWRDMIGTTSDVSDLVSSSTYMQHIIESNRLNAAQAAQLVKTPAMIAEEVDNGLTAIAAINNAAGAPVAIAPHGNITNARGVHLILDQYQTAANVNIIKNLYTANINAVRFINQTTGITGALQAAGGAALPAPTAGGNSFNAGDACDNGEFLTLLVLAYNKVLRKVATINAGGGVIPNLDLRPRNNAVVNNTADGYTDYVHSLHQALYSNIPIAAAFTNAAGGNGAVAAAAAGHNRNFIINDPAVNAAGANAGVVINHNNLHLISLITNLYDAYVKPLEHPHARETIAHDIRNVAAGAAAAAGGAAAALGGSRAAAAAARPLVPVYGGLTMLQALVKADLILKTAINKAKNLAIENIVSLVKEMYFVNDNTEVVNAFVNNFVKYIISQHLNVPYVPNAYLAAGALPPHYDFDNVITRYNVMCNNNDSIKHGHYPYRLENVANYINQSLGIYSISKSLNDVIELTEGSNYNNNLNTLAKSFGANLGGLISDNRSSMRVKNILDAGIVPLNVHAFMREVPFVNLLNYSYTFDRMIHDFLLPNFINKRVNDNNSIDEEKLMIKSTDSCGTTRELLVQLLVHPYADLRNNTGDPHSNDGYKYFNILANLFNGNDNLKLGRPRYLSDQLWHKVLLTSSAQLVAGQEQFDQQNQRATNRFSSTLPSLEGGPSAYEAVRAYSNYGRDSINVARNNGAVAAAPAVELTLNGDPVSTSGLKFWKDNTWQVANKNNDTQNMHAADVIYCAEIGKMRFDTKLVRNLVWFVHLQRIMRVILIKHLSWINTPVVKGLKISDSKITEFNSNEKFEDADFDGSNYEPI